MINTAAQTAAAIASFYTDISNSMCMTDKKNAVQFLANKIGAESANKIAEAFGIKSSYYKAA